VGAVLPIWKHLCDARTMALSGHSARKAAARCKCKTYPPSSSLPPTHQPSKTQPAVSLSLLLARSRTAPSLRPTVNGNTVRNFPTHGQPSAAQGNLTSCLNFDFAILNCLTPRLCSLIDGPEVEHGAHFLILYYTTPTLPPLSFSDSLSLATQQAHARGPSEPGRRQPRHRAARRGECVSLTVSLTVSPSLCLPHYVSLTVSPSLCLPHYVSLTVSPSLCLSLCLTRTTTCPSSRACAAWRRRTRSAR
jgi:hypothetical protein